MSPGSLALGAGSAGQITLTAAGGPVSWSASPSAAQVSLSAYSGTLQAGQSVTLDVTVTRGSGGGSAVISIAPPAAAPQTVEVGWTSRPIPGGADGSGYPKHSRHDPSPSPSPSSPSSPSPTASLPSPRLRSGTTSSPGEP